MLYFLVFIIDIHYSGIVLLSVEVYVRYKDKSFGCIGVSNKIIHAMFAVIISKQIFVEKKTI